MERPSRPPTLSLVNSSHIESTLKGRPSAVVANMKSSAQTWLGRSACRRLAGTVLFPSRRRLGKCCGTRSPSSRHGRCTRLWFTFQPSIRSTAQLAYFGEFDQLGFGSFVAAQAAKASTSRRSLRISGSTSPGVVVSKSRAVQS